MPRGGHFAAYEQPQLLADDIRCFVDSLQPEPVSLPADAIASSGIAARRSAL
ncbi:MAG TPA: hypothetical protein VFJ93_03450 [Gaiellaceae bacterium]|jgi:hypothetical protein|nr:hypothetical protein [Gaiellaceae bacterium]